MKKMHTQNRHPKSIKFEKNNNKKAKILTPVYQPVQKLTYKIDLQVATAHSATKTLMAVRYLTNLSLYSYFNTQISII